MVTVLLVDDLTTTAGVVDTSYADAAGPSGRVTAPRTESVAVRVHRGDDVETVVVQ